MKVDPGLRPSAFIQATTHNFPTRSYAAWMKQSEIQEG